MFQAKAAQEPLPPRTEIPIAENSIPDDESGYDGDQPTKALSPCCPHGQSFREILSRLRKQELPGSIHAEGFLHRLYQRHCRISTIRLYETAIRFFLSFLQKCGQVPLNRITKPDLGAFIEHEQDRGLRVTTVKTRLDIIYAFLSYLVEVDVVNPDVIARKLKIKQPELLPKAIPAEEINLFLTGVDDVRDRAMFLLLLRTGLRIGELLDLKVTDINLDQKKIMIYEARKTHLGRTAYFSADALEALRDWLKKRDQEKVYLFYGQRRNRLSYAAARVRFMTYLEKAGLSDKGYTIHCLRHTYATELLNAGMRLECLQQLLGHVNIEVTRRYARLSDRTREEEYFRAMTIIERSGHDGDQLDRELAAILETEKLLETHG